MCERGVYFSKVLVVLFIALVCSLNWEILLIFVLKNQTCAVHKTPASTNLFFLNSALRLRPLFTLCRFPGNPILAVLLPWELKSPSQVCVVSTWMTLSKEACRDPSFITLFFSGSKVTELTLAHTWLPISPQSCPLPPPPHPPTQQWSIGDADGSIKSHIHDQWDFFPDRPLVRL